MAWQYVAQVAISVAVSAIGAYLTRDRGGREDLRQGEEFQGDNISRARWGDPLPLRWGTNYIQSFIEVASGDKTNYSVNLDPGGGNLRTYFIKYLITIFLAYGQGRSSALREVWLDDHLIWDGEAEDGVKTRGGFLGYNHQRIHPPFIAFNTYRDKFRQRRATQAYHINYNFSDNYDDGSNIYGQIYYWQGNDTIPITRVSELRSALQRIVAQQRGISEAEALKWIPGYKDIPMIIFTGYTYHDGYKGIAPHYGFEINNIPRFRKLGIVDTSIENPLGLPNNGEIPHNFVQRGKRVSIPDCNPATVYYQILEKIGVPRNRIDRQSFIDAGIRYYNERNTRGNGISFMLTTRHEAHTLVDRLSRLVDSNLNLNSSTDIYSVKLIRNDLDEDELEVLTNDHIKRIRITPRNVTDVFNEFRLTIEDREIGYKANVAHARLQSEFEKGNGNNPGDATETWIKNPLFGHWVAEDRLRDSNIPYREIDTELHDNILTTKQSGDAFRVEYLQHGKDKTNQATTRLFTIKLRVVNTTFGEYGNNTQNITCVQDRESVATPVFVPATIRPTRPQSFVIQPEEHRTVFELPPPLNRLISTNLEDSHLVWFASQGDREIFSYDTLINVNNGGLEPDIGNVTFVSRGVVADVGNINSYFPINKADAANVNMLISNLSNPQYWIDAPSISNEEQRKGKYLMYFPRTGEFMVFGVPSLNQNTLAVSDIKRQFSDTVRTGIRRADEVWVSRDILNVTSRTPIESDAMVIYRLLTKNSVTTLSEALAVQSNYQMQQRVLRPAPPAIFTVGSNTDGDNLQVPFGGAVTINQKLKSANSIKWEWEQAGYDADTDRTIIVTRTANGTQELTVMDPANQTTALKRTYNVDLGTFTVGQQGVTVTGYRQKGANGLRSLYGVENRVVITA